MIKRRLLCEYREKSHSLILLKNGLDKKHGCWWLLNIEDRFIGGSQTNVYTLITFWEWGILCFIKSKTEIWFLWIILLGFFTWLNLREVSSRYEILQDFFILSMIILSELNQNYKESQTIIICFYFEINTMASIYAQKRSEKLW